LTGWFDISCSSVESSQDGFDRAAQTKLLERNDGRLALALAALGFLERVPERVGLVVVGPDVKSLDAASLRQGLQAEIVESRGSIFPADLLDRIHGKRVLMVDFAYEDMEGNYVLGDFKSAAGFYYSYYLQLGAYDFQISENGGFTPKGEKIFLSLGREYPEASS